MTYPNEPTIDESINQFFVFIEEYKEREDLDDSIENWDEEEEGEEHPYFQNLKAFENVKKFIEEAFEIAVGENGLTREFHPDEIIERLKEFSDNALKWEEGEEMTTNNWSERYFQTLTPEQHAVNNRWFIDMLSLLKDDGVLGVPMLNKCFDKQGREVTEL